MHDKIKKVLKEAEDFKISPLELAGLIDHTNLYPYEVKENIKKLCDEAKEYSFSSVCVHPNYVDFCKKLLEGTTVNVDTVIGFPLGQNTTDIKCQEALDAIHRGADEIDVVTNIGRFRGLEYDYVKKELMRVITTMTTTNKISDSITTKLIIETGYLRIDEIKKICKLAENAGFDFVKNSTGFGPYGANIPHIKIMNESTSESVKVKASGGIHNYEDAIIMIVAGADRIGASSGVKIVESLKERNIENKEFESFNIDNLCPSSMASKKDLPNEVFNHYKEICDKC